MSFSQGFVLTSISAFAIGQITSDVAPPTPKTDPKRTRTMMKNTMKITQMKRKKPLTRTSLAPSIMTGSTTQKIRIISSRRRPPCTDPYPPDDQCTSLCIFLNPKPGTTAGTSTADRLAMSRAARMAMGTTTTTTAATYTQVCMEAATTRTATTTVTTTATRILTTMKTTTPI